MYYRLKYGKYYLIKIIVLVLAAVLGELVIWWAMVREESSDYIVNYVVHKPWPYAISQLEDNRSIIGNVIIGFEITLPKTWQVENFKHPSFIFSQEGEIICEIKSNIIKQKEEVEISSLIGGEEGYIRTYVGRNIAVKSENVTGEGNFIYKLKIPIEDSIIEYSLFAKQENKYVCRRDFEKIRKSFIYYE